MSTKYTPGPWKLEYDGEDDAGTFTIYMADAIENRGSYDCAHSIELYDGEWPSEDPDNKQFAEILGNAQLIAAAPELAEALTNFCQAISLPMTNVERAARDQARAALKKAGLI